MRRSLTAGLTLGALNAVVAIATFAIVEALTPNDFGWFAYAPLNEVVVEDPRFPWHYVVVPLALVVANVLAVPVLVRRATKGSVPSGSSLDLSGGCAGA